MCKQIVFIWFLFMCVVGLIAQNNISNCYSAGNVLVNPQTVNPRVGGMVATNYGNVTDCYWDNQASGQTTSAGGTGKTTVEMKTQATYVGWDFNSTWAIDQTSSINNGYPFLNPANAIGDQVQSAEAKLNFSIYPNPFNPVTTIQFNLEKKSQVVITVYNLRGQKIRSIQNNILERGKHSFTWKGDDDSGNKVASGIYLAQLSTESFKKIKKMIVLK